MTKDIIRSIAIFIVGLLIAVSGASSFDFDMGQITFYAGFTTLIGIGLMVFSTIFFFIYRNRKNNSNKH